MDGDDGDDGDDDVVDVTALPFTSPSEAGGWCGLLANITQLSAADTPTQAVVAAMFSATRPIGVVEEEASMVTSGAFGGTALVQRVM